MPAPKDRAFPTRTIDAEHGMDLRTYLAGQAMVGYLSTNDADDYTAEGIAKMSVYVADCLIEELNDGFTPAAG